MHSKEKAIRVGRYRAPSLPPPIQRQRRNFWSAAAIFPPPIPPPPHQIPTPPPQTLTNPSSIPPPISQIEDRSHLFSAPNRNNPRFPCHFSCDSSISWSSSVSNSSPLLRIPHPGIVYFPGWISGSHFPVPTSRSTGSTMACRATDPSKPTSERPPVAARRLGSSNRWSRDVVSAPSTAAAFTSAWSAPLFLAPTTPLPILRRTRVTRSRLMSTELRSSAASVPTRSTIPTSTPPLWRSSSWSCPKVERKIGVGKGGPRQLTISKGHHRGRLF